MIKLRARNTLENISNVKIKQFRDSIIKWHRKNNRDHLLWRNTTNTYYILISEIMLQKTTVKQVENTIHKFIEKYPSPEKLANTTKEDIKKIIMPLGMQHNRSDRLHKLANIIMLNYNGKVPNEYDTLISLPGVGRYIANSILYLAYEKQVPIVDTNIVRIIERVFNYVSNKRRPRNDNKMWDFIDSITPSGRSKDVNLALLDFSALVCTSRNPKHENCPVSKICSHYKKYIFFSE